MEFESIVSSPIGPLTLRATEINLTALVLESDKNRLMRMIKKMLDDERVRNEAEVYA